MICNNSSNFVNIEFHFAQIWYSTHLLFEYLFNHGLFPCQIEAVVVVTHPQTTRWATNQMMNLTLVKAKQ